MIQIKSVVFGFLMMLLVSLMANAKVGGGPQASYLMVSLGDSITAAFLADTHLLEFRSYQVSENLTTTEIKEWVRKRSLFSHRDTLSWSSGQKIKSHYMLLKEYLAQNEPDSEVDVLNVAVPGAKTKALLGQVGEVAKKMSQGKYDSLKYVTLLIGANDICHSLPVSTVKNNVWAALESLNRIPNVEKIRVLVSAVPKIPDLGAPQVVEMKTIAGLTCSILRDRILKTCKPLLNWNSQAEYDSRVKIVEDLNATLQSVVAQANQSLSHLDLVFSTQAYDHVLDPSDLAIECFHPNYAAQQLLSEELWGDQPWFH